MHSNNTPAIKIRKADFLRLPDDCRAMNNGPMVKTVKGGAETFVPAEIID